MRKNRKTYILKLLVLLLVVQFFAQSSLQAQNKLSDTIISERLQYIKNTLEKDKLNTKRWWYAWFTTYGVATFGQTAVYFISDDKSLQQDMLLGAATTLLGAAGQFISPLDPRNETAHFNSMPELTVDQKLLKLDIAEELLVEWAKREKEARNWQNHALTGAVNLGGGLITWLGFKRSIWAGLGNFALNTVITETQIWTQPTLAKRNYEKYCQNYLNSDEMSSDISDVKCYVNAYPGGIGIRVVF